MVCRVGGAIVSRIAHMKIILDPFTWDAAFMRAGTKMANATVLAISLTRMRIGGSENGKMEPRWPGFSGTRIMGRKNMRELGGSMRNMGNITMGRVPSGKESPPITGSSKWASSTGAEWKPGTPHKAKETHMWANFSREKFRDSENSLGEKEPQKKFISDSGLNPKCTAMVLW